MTYHVRKSVEGPGWLVQVVHTTHGTFSKPTTIHRLPHRKGALTVARLLAGRNAKIEVHS